MKKLPMLALALFFLYAATPFMGSQTNCIEGDCFNGRGTMVYASGSKYEGEWLNGKKHGQGIYTRPDGASYDGEWQDGSSVTIKA